MSADLTGGGSSFTANAAAATIVGDGISLSVNGPRTADATAWISSSCMFNATVGRFFCRH